MIRLTASLGEAVEEELSEAVDLLELQEVSRLSPSTLPEQSSRPLVPPRMKTVPLKWRRIVKSIRRAVRLKARTQLLAMAMEILRMSGDGEISPGEVIEEVGGEERLADRLGGVFATREVVEEEVQEEVEAGFGKIKLPPEENHTSLPPVRSDY
jgi:hypothetical protein